MFEASKTGNGFRRNDSDLRRDIVKNTSMQEDDRPKTENMMVPKLELNGSKKDLGARNSGSVSTTERNMKFKLEQLEEKLE